MSAKYAYKRGGGLSGKAQRARGKRSQGRPAAFGGAPRVLLDGEAPTTTQTEIGSDEEEDEEAQELRRKFAKRDLGSNAHRYDEPEAEAPEDGDEIEPEPEVDLSRFLERQRQEVVDDPPKTVNDDIDHSLDQLLGSSSRNQATAPRNYVQTIAWTEDMQAMAEEKSQADAARELSTRFRSRTNIRGAKPPTARGRGGSSAVSRAVPLEQPGVVAVGSEEFLDDLLG